MEFIHKDISKWYTPLKMKVIYKNKKRYYVNDDGTPYISITSLLSDFKKPVIDRWRKRVGNKTANKECKHATTRGNSIHSIIESYLKNQDPKFFKYTTLSKSLFQQAKPLLDKNINNIYIQEQQIFSPTLGVAGRCDLLAEWDGKLSIVDFKGSKKRKPIEWLDDYFMQGAFYCFGFYEMTKIVPKNMVILIIAEDFTNTIFVEKPSKWIDRLQEQVKKYKTMAYT